MGGVHLVLCRQRAQLVIANQQKDQGQKDSTYWKKDADDMRAKLAIEENRLTSQEMDHKQAIAGKDSEVKAAQEQAATLKGRVQELEKQVAGGTTAPPGNIGTPSH